MLHESGYWDTAWSLFHRFASPDSGSISTQSLRLMRNQAGLGLDQMLPLDKFPEGELFSVDEFGLWLHQTCGQKFERLMARLNGDSALDESRMLSPSQSLMTRSVLQEMPLAEATEDDADADASEALDKYSFALIS